MINKVTLIGHVGQDPDIRTMENGTIVGRFSLATNESYKDREGNWQSHTEWHNVVVWRDLAERAKMLKKGSTVYVDGKISSRKYTDRDGVEKNITDIVANTFRLLDKKQGDEQDSRFPSDTSHVQGSSPVVIHGGQSSNVNQDAPPTVEGDDLPF